MKKILLIIIVIAVVALSGCSLFGSDEASIVSFDVDGIVGSADVDPVNLTVTVTVEPMDISSIEPEITVSEKALITEPSSIQDGVPATYIVTAENGDVVEWTVTVNVQYGVSFLLDGIKIILTGGWEYSDDATWNSYMGAGVPGIDVDSGQSLGYVYEERYDLAMGAPDYDSISFELEGSTADSYADQEFMFADYSEDSEILFTCDFVVSEFGMVGEDFRASFNGTEEMPSRALKSLTSGYAKLLVVEAFPMP